jgi:hypothetical protein
MKVQRDKHTAEYSQVNRITTIKIDLEGEFPCNDQKLDNILQFVLLQLGIDTKYQDPPTEPPAFNFPEPPPIPLVEDVPPPQKTLADVEVQESSA